MQNKKYIRFQTEGIEMKYKDQWNFKITDDINPDLQDQIFEELSKLLSLAFQLVFGAE